MKQIWKLHDGKPNIPDNVAFVLFRDGLILPVAPFTAGSTYCWNSLLWYWDGENRSYDIVAYHCEGEHRG